MSLTQQLQRQLAFLERSSASYDAGHVEEALRLAVSLRVLFHDTARSVSLMTHLGLWATAKIPSTIGTGKDKERLKGKIILSIPVMLTSEGIKPPLGSATSVRILEAKQWWNEVVMAQSSHFSRKDIVLAAADQDGGAHVDAVVSPGTEELREGIGTLTLGVDSAHETTTPLTNHHFPMLRQFAYEVSQCVELKTAAHGA